MGREPCLLSVWFSGRKPQRLVVKKEKEEAIEYSALPATPTWHHSRKY
jgi:hypothetical protein